MYVTYATSAFAMRRPIGERDELLHRARLLLDDEGDHARGDREREERKLFHGRVAGQSGRAARRRAAAARTAASRASASPSAPARAEHDDREIAARATGCAARNGRRPSIVSIQKSVLRTSLRSAIQATDSTCSGCTAKSAATNQRSARARPSCGAEARRAAARSPRASTTFVTWCAPASRPNSSHVEHVRDPGQRMPVARVTGRERPADALAA